VTELPGPTLDEIRAARERASAVAVVTPMESSRFLTELLEVPVHLKAENLQRTGSYKIRGAYNRLARLSEEERARGVVAASAGNHAQGVALAARELGIRATIFMPIGVALPKLQATRDYGADVVLHGHVVDETLQRPPSSPSAPAPSSSRRSIIRMSWPVRAASRSRSWSRFRTSPM